MVRLEERDRCSKSATVVVQIAIKNRSIEVKDAFRGK